MADDKLFVGLDIGGTSVKIGLFDAEGARIGKASVPTPPLVDAAGYGALTDGVRRALDEVGADLAAVAAIGAAVPCPVDAEGRIGMTANIELDDVGMRDALRAFCPNAAFEYVNDANAAAMGELWAGAARGRSNVVFVTIGTGVGGGVVVDGKIVAGAFGAGGEIGHMCVNPDERRVCGCGGRGHLEQYASATGVVSNYLAECEKRGVEPIALTGPSDSKDVFQACREGDEVAIAGMRTMAEYLGRALSLIGCVVDPECFVLGGGASASADVYLDDLTAAYRRYAMTVNQETPIEIASLGNDAGMYGAAYVALQAAES